MQPLPSLLLKQKLGASLSRTFHQHKQNSEYLFLYNKLLQLCSNLMRSRHKCNMSQLITLHELTCKACSTLEASATEWKWTKANPRGTPVNLSSTRRMSLTVECCAMAMCKLPSLQYTAALSSRMTSIGVMWCAIATLSRQQQHNHGSVNSYFPIKISFVGVPQQSLDSARETQDSDNEHPAV